MNKTIFIRRINNNDRHKQYTLRSGMETIRFARDTRAHMSVGNDDGHQTGGRQVGCVFFFALRLVGFDRTAAIRSTKWRRYCAGASLINKNPFSEQIGLRGNSINNNY